MGATDFMTTGEGKTAQDAFDSAVKSAEWEHGHGGYTGTIAEKDSFKMARIPPGIDAKELVDYMTGKISHGEYVSGGKFVKARPDLSDAAEKVIDQFDDKWGPAGCIKIADGKWLFFGVASI